VVVRSCCSEGADWDARWSRWIEGTEECLRRGGAGKGWEPWHRELSGL
jgi:hypothetical protein